jgi:hypothetical protein
MLAFHLYVYLCVTLLLSVHNEFIRCLYIMVFTVSGACVATKKECVPLVLGQT